MEIRVAKTAGFCFGVKRAVETVYEQAGTEGENIYTYGPIIHNEEVVRDLAEKGVGVLEGPEDLAKLTEGTVIIRSHGVGKTIYDRIREQGLKLVDATCPFVAKIHRIVEEQSALGKHIIVMGNPQHPEVLGIVGWASGPVSVVQTPEDTEKLEIPDSVSCCVVSQTTFNYKKFQDLVENLEKKGYDSYVVNTICSATHERQAEAGELASQVDTMIVIGGKHSSNTQKLYEICRKECGNTYYIQTFRDLRAEDLPFGDIVGITAGASTPSNIIEEVKTNVRFKF
ncbi:MAG: 4-hydroxy-3-methylbut-2-enyl diphosphate reductase [Lachnospiraceae bacterium]|nr:4-hydroxy-3-methylbut-2-enyl diphosphate reductase [Lachnospiraceae bacterium]